MTEEVTEPEDIPEPGTPKVNPFDVPPWTVRRALSPWEEPEHQEYYVEVDNGPRVIDDFTSAMSDLTTLRRGGHLVLVIGGSGCGKSAMVNWCAHHALTRMKAEEMSPQIIDVTTTFDGVPRELDLKTRRTMVADRLVTELVTKGLVKGDQREAMERNREHLDRVLPALPASLDPDTADSLVVLLPKAEIADEVIRYCGLHKGKVLLLVESADLDDRLREIEAAAKIAPIMLEVGKLNSGDTERFVDDRFRRAQTRGAYPRMSKETISKVASARWLDTIGQLQNTLHGTFGWKRRTDPAYGTSAMVTFEDILQYKVNELTSSRPDRDGRRH